LRPFVPLFRNPHLSTLAGNFWPRQIEQALPPTVERIYETEPGVRVLVHENRPAGPARGEVLMLHGLEGSSASGYMVSMASALAQAGYAAHRVNLRSCGGSEHLSPTLYHSGLTSDMRALAARFRREGRGPVYLVGFSLGGNVVLKLAGELGEEAPALVDGACAVSTPIDLAECVRRLGARENWIYERRFVRSLCARYRRKHAADPERFPIDGLEKVRTIYEFDDRFTSKAFGFGDAANYYRTQSSIRFVGGIRVPTLVVQAKNDPLIPFELFESGEIRKVEAIQVLAVEHGGHLGFLARRRPRFWLDGVVLEWLNQDRNKAGMRTV
jgi:hypothetical protein